MRYRFHGNSSFTMMFSVLFIWREWKESPQVRNKAVTFPTFSVQSSRWCDPFFLFFVCSVLLPSESLLNKNDRCNGWLHYELWAGFYSNGTNSVLILFLSKRLKGAAVWERLPGLHLTRSAQQDPLQQSEATGAHSPHLWSSWKPHWETSRHGTKRALLQHQHRNTPAKPLIHSQDKLLRRVTGLVAKHYACV